jgi:hypothetical protein
VAGQAGSKTATKVVTEVVKATVKLPAHSWWMTVVLAPSKWTGKEASTRLPRGGRSGGAWSSARVWRKVRAVTTTLST